MGYDEIVSELNAARLALQADDLDALDASLDRLSSEYDSMKPAEQATVARLQVARTESELTNEQHETIGTYERWFMTTYFGRGAFLAGSDLYLLDPGEADSEDLVNQAAELADREVGLRDATSDTVDVLEGVSLPPRIGVLSYSSADQSPTLGDEFRVDIRLRNVGDRAASNVTATLSSEALGVNEVSTIGEIHPGDSWSGAFELTASIGGSVELSLTVESDNAGSLSESESVLVRTKTSILETVIATVEEFIERVGVEAGNKGKVRSVNSKLDAARESLNRAMTEMERGRNKQANNAINTGVNQLQALINYVDGGRGSSLPETLRTALLNRIRLSTDHLEDAQRAPIDS